MRGIVEIETRKLKLRLEDRAIGLSISGLALDYLAEVGFDPVHSARPLKRTIPRELKTTVVIGILKG